MNVAAARVRVSPTDHGKPMPLELFAHAETDDDCLYELDRGIVLKIDVRGTSHMRVVLELRELIVEYERLHPGSINALLSAGEMVLRSPKFESERHPDLAVYLLPPPVDTEQPWDSWIPEIVIEVVSKSSR